MGLVLVGFSYCFGSLSTYLQIPPHWPLFDEVANGCHRIHGLNYLDWAQSLLNSANSSKLIMMGCILMRLAEKDYFGKLSLQIPCIFERVGENLSLICAITYKRISDKSSYISHAYTCLFIHFPPPKEIDTAPQYKNIAEVLSLRHPLICVKFLERSIQPSKITRHST